MASSTIRNKDGMEGPPVKVTTIGIDVEKSVFGADGHYFTRAYEIVSPPAPEIVR